ncbi:hypothetical protein [Paraburkholderia aspalathi]|uniref:Uncharacterized protein n=1 Tax=Paraburkholderia aspalathi TaxID=1324617 RepID=A0A1I7EL85_9BURK|nr:hypothetical protein [Paraburkholderia aspalathi]SFU24693.1 hypothetical protein SAMN05192563_10291 [Paraburkholderia aspalathi]
MEVSIEELDHIPPAIPLLISEVFAKSKDWHVARRRLKEMLPELKRQSEIYEVSAASRTRVSAAPGSLAVYLDGGLDLFSEDQGCQAIGCRVEAAKRLTRSIGLIADTIWLTDLVTEKFCRFGRVTNRKLDEILGHALVLLELYPLMAAGIVKFRSPWIRACSACLDHFNEEVDRIAETLQREHSEEFSLEPHPAGGFSFKTGSLYDPPLYLHVLPRGSAKSDLVSLQDLVHGAVRSAVHSALWTGREAVIGSGAIFSNSGIGLAGLAYKEGAVRNRSELRLLDERRSVNVPWVSDLTSPQIIQLRQEAASALPMFREMLAKHLSTPGDGDGALSSRSVVDDLRQQSVEVRNELGGIQRHAARFWKSSYTLLGFGVSAYGVATSQVLPAVGGLLPIIQLIMSHKSGTEREMEKVTYRPGYVLVKAQEILAHNH